MKTIQRLIGKNATDVGTWEPTCYTSLKQARNLNPGEYADEFRIATGERTVTGHISGFPIVHKTRFSELGYWNVPSSPGEGPSFWQCVDLTGDKPAQVGTQYATKAELLANLEVYATEYGCDNANPLSPTRLSHSANKEEHLWIYSMGKKFRVRHVATSDDDTNHFIAIGSIALDRAAR